MNQQRPSALRSSALCVALLFGVAAAPTVLAAEVTAAQEAKIKVGMSMDEVRQLLGAPAHIVRVRYSPGPTWTYDYNTGSKVRDLEVDFDGANKVMWIQVTDMRISSSH